MKENPLVSVIIPAYNSEKYIVKAIDSALEQDVPVEIIVINDCSSDGTEAAVGKYSGLPNVHYYKNERNMGAAASRNWGVALAAGKYVAFLDADDWWEPGKLRKQLELIEKENMVICSTARELMNPDGSPMGKSIPVHERISYRMLLKQNEINCSSVLLKRDVALEFPMEHEDCHEDYITWMKILKKYQYACAVNEPLLKYRLSSQGKSGSKLKSAMMTFKTYRRAGFSCPKAAVCFISYALNGIYKYCFPTSNML